MAEIKMDVSEYETMKENAKLLQNSLDREKEMQETISNLRDEKIQALEDASKKVVTITKTEHHEVIYNKRSDNEIIDMLSRFCHHVNERGHHGRHRDFGMHPYTVEQLVEACFEKISTTSNPTVTTTVQGLDEVKKEMKDKAFDKLSTSTKEKLAKAEVIIINANKAGIEKKELVEKLNKFEDFSDTQSKKIEEFEVQVKEVKLLKDSYNAIKDKVFEDIKVFGSRDTIYDTRTIIRETDSKLSKL